MKRTRLWLGILGLVSPSYLIFEPVERLTLAWARLTEFGPYALIALAILNLGRAVTRSALVLVGPAILVTIAVALAYRPKVGSADAVDLAVALAFARAVALGM